MKKYKNIGKEKTIAIRTKQNETFLKRTGALLYKNMKLNPVMLSDKVRVRIGLKLLNAGCMKRTEQEIKLIKSDTHIEVINTLQVKNIGDTSNGVGLKNIHQQYKFFTEAPIEIQQTDQFFSVKLPLLKSVKS